MRAQAESALLLSLSLKGPMLAMNSSVALAATQPLAEDRAPTSHAKLRLATIFKRHVVLTVALIQALC